MFLANMLNDFMCTEDKMPKRPPPYYPPIDSRQKANPNASQVGMSAPSNQGTSQPSEWSKIPPQQGGQARNNGASPPQARTRGVGGSPDAPPSPSRARGSPQNGGRPQQQRQQPQNDPKSQGWYSQDEMNPRDAQSRADVRGASSSGPPGISQQLNNQLAPGNNQQASGSSQQTQHRLPVDKAQARQQQMQQRQMRDDDTVIGKGFTAAMKRGVAQAKPNALHEELVAQKDGGFISTIQRGFEGLFGKPTSKEEVLRNRGAVWANEYEAVPGDEVDFRVQFFARKLPEDVAGCLKIFRQSRGEYQINEEKVNMEIRYRQNLQGQTDQEIFVFWTTEEGEQSDPEPLGLYLSHAANVAYEVKQGGNVITQVPEHVRMSFHDEKGTKLTDGSADARFNAMEVAARQARMREDAANEWRQKQSRRPCEAPEEESQAQQRNEEAPKVQERQQSREAPQSSIIDDALAAFGNLLQPPLAPSRSMATPAAAPVPIAFPPMPQPMQGFQQPNGLGMPMGSNAGTFYGASQAGTFYGGSQYGGSHYGGSQYGVPRQGTMYAYGSAQPVIATASAGHPGFFGAAAPSRQGPQGGSMYAYGSAYPVPVR